MSDAPDRIWATVNGMSTRLPDGVRQLIGGWSQDQGRPNAVEYVRASLMSSSENTLKKQLVDTQEKLIAANAKLINTRTENARLQEAQLAERRTIADAIAFVQKRLDDYVREFGFTDPETGTVEFPGTGDEYIGELEEIIEGLTALEATPQFLNTEDGEFNGNAHASATNEEEEEEEEIAKLIWERFAPAHEVEWPSGNAGEYRQVAKDIVQRLLP